MSLLLRSRIVVFVCCLAALGLAGCGAPEGPPPASESVTTEPLDIDLPAKGDNAAPAGDAATPAKANSEG